MFPKLGDIVIYTSENDDGVRSPAIVLRTRESTVLDVIEDWQGPDSTLSGVSRPMGLISELADDHTVDLVVFGLGGDYRRYSVAQGDFIEDGPDVYKPRWPAGTWQWPERIR